MQRHVLAVSPVRVGASLQERDDDVRGFVLVGFLDGQCQRLRSPGTTENPTSNHGRQPNGRRCQPSRRTGRFDNETRPGCSEGGERHVVEPFKAGPEEAVHAGPACDEGLDNSRVAVPDRL
eukprot:2460584-Rhodomonas_salina.5